VKVKLKCKKCGRVFNGKLFRGFVSGFEFVKFKCECGNQGIEIVSEFSSVSIE